MIRFIIFLCLSLSMVSAASADPCVDNLASHVVADTLYIQSCYIEGPADFSVIGQFLQANPKVTGLNMSDSSNDYLFLTPDNVKYLLAAPSLLSLDMSYNWFLNPAIFEVVAASKTLKNLNLATDDLTAETIKVLARNTSIETLNLTSITRATADDLAVLIQNHTLKSLKLDGHSLNDNLVQSIAMMQGLEAITLGDEYSIISERSWLKLTTNKNLKRIGIAYQHLTPAVIQMLAANKNLESLSLVQDDINNDEAALIATLPNLRSLFLDKNAIGDIGLLAIAQNASLQVVSVASNPITEVGVLGFAKQSQAVVLNFNQDLGITAKSLHAILSMPGLVSLDIAKTGVNDEMGLQLAKVQLQCLNVEFNHITDQAGEAFAKEGQVGKLAVLGNELSDDEVAAIKQNPAIGEVIDDYFTSFGSCVGTN